MFPLPTSEWMDKDVIELYENKSRITKRLLGGVAIYVKNGISHELDETMSEESNEIETIGLSITATNKGNI